MCSAKPNSSKEDTSMGTRDVEKRMRGVERVKKYKKIKPVRDLGNRRSI